MNADHRLRVSRQLAELMLTFPCDAPYRIVLTRIKLPVWTVERSPCMMQCRIRHWISGMLTTVAKFTVGQVVRHRFHPFRGVIFDVDPTFSNTDEWWESIPEENRPKKDQPFYHLLAENETSYYVAYVSEQNLVTDESGEPVDHPEVAVMFGPLRESGRYDIDGQLH